MASFITLFWSTLLWGPYGLWNALHNHLFAFFWRSSVLWNSSDAGHSRSEVKRCFFFFYVHTSRAPVLSMQNLFILQCFFVFFFLFVLHFIPLLIVLFNYLCKIHFRSKIFGWNASSSFSYFFIFLYFGYVLYLLFLFFLTVIISH